jgi:hypothetical protein
VWSIRWMRCDVSRCGLHCALHSSLYARPSLRASVTASLRTSLAGLFTPPATLLDGTAEHTKAQAVEPDARREPAAVRRTAVDGVAAPAATPVHPARA